MLTSPPIEIKLTPAETRLAAEMGVTRQLMNLFKKRPDAYGCDKSVGWQVHIEGCCGELVVAKYLGIYWNGNFEKLKADDVGHFQVRTRSEHAWDMLLHDRDPDDRPFILVTGTAPEYLIHGWMYARDGKKEKFWKDPARGRPAYFVPKPYLEPMETLPR
jgi:hypothetical protein